jgi:pheromone shutdown-related protein TraB
LRVDPTPAGDPPEPGLKARPTGADGSPSGRASLLGSGRWSTLPIPAEDSIIDREASAAQRRDYGADVHVVELEGREFVLVGTAHISRESVDLVREVIEKEEPDCVCIELDDRRYQALSRQQRFESLDLKQVIRAKQLATLMLNLVLVSYQRYLGLKLGVQPGTELLEAARTAEERGIPVALCDRDIRVTLRRAWRSLPWYRKLLLLSSMLAGIFEKPELTEEDLRELRQQDVMSKLMQELGSAFPGLKTVLIDERDAYLTERIRQASGERIVAVVGAGHVDGMRRALAGGGQVDLEGLEVTPAVSPVWKWIGWGIPAVILGSLLLIGLRQGAAAAGENLLFWILINGIPSGLGAVAALAHPATIGAALVAAPITSLTPVIGAGYVAAFVQAYFKPPLVSELKEVSQEIGSLAGWWRNRLLRIFLVFVFTTLGSLFGTYVGGFEIVSNLF